MKFRKLIYSFIFVLVFPLIVNASGNTVLRVNTSKSGVNVGDTVTITVSVSSPDQAMNAVSGSLIYPSNLSLSSISKQGTVINFWTQEAQNIAGRISFEGVIVSPGYQGQAGKIFTATFVAKKEGTTKIYFSDGAILANDGLGTNIIDSLGSTNIVINSLARGDYVDITKPYVGSNTTNQTNSKLVALPIITDYSSLINTSDQAYIKGKGEPNALTKLTFNDIAAKSLGERFIALLQTKKKKLEPVLVKNNDKGEFEYKSQDNLVAGTYNATPFLVDSNNQTERPGLGVQLFVNDSKAVKYLVVLINILGLLIPIVGLIVIIYFIPWYSWRRMRVLKKKLGLEERKIEATESQLKRQDIILDNSLTHSVFPDER